MPLETNLGANLQNWEFGWAIWNGDNLKLQYVMYTRVYIEDGKVYGEDILGGKILKFVQM